MMHEPPAPAVILVVYEEPVLAQVVTRFLRHLGYTVQESTCEVQALEMARSCRPPIDLILVDAGRGGGGGMVLAEVMDAESYPPQVIRLVDQSTRAIGGVDRLGRRVQRLPKPIDLDQLQALLRVMLPALLPEEECDLAAVALSRAR